MPHKYKSLFRQDSKLCILLKEIPDQKIIQLSNNGKVREHLIQSIISQQLSIKVAPIIFQRFLNLFGGSFPANHKILSIETEQLRSCGLSLQKAKYIQNIANFFSEQKLNNEFFYTLSDEEIIQTLTQIKGVGRWTVEMVLIFCLGREDVFSVGDYGIQVAMKKIYNINKEKKELEKKMLKIAENWRPFRSYASLYLWASKDLKIEI